MRNAAELFSFDPNPTRAKNAWSSSTCLLYASNHLPSACCLSLSVCRRSSLPTGEGERVGGAKS
jgi:hypothetical protein